MFLHHVVKQIYRMIRQSYTMWYSNCLAFKGRVPWGSSLPHTQGQLVTPLFFFYKHFFVLFMWQRCSCIEDSRWAEALFTDFLHGTFNHTHYARHVLWVKNLNKGLEPFGNERDCTVSLVVTWDSSIRNRKPTSCVKRKICSKSLKS